MTLPVLEYGDILYDQTNRKLLDKLQTLQNRCLHTCLLPKEHIPTIRLHELCSIGNLCMRPKRHLQFYMYKQKGNIFLVNNRDVLTRAHDALFHHQISTCIVKVKFREVNVVLLPGTSSGK